MAHDTSRFSLSNAVIPSRKPTSGGSSTKHVELAASAYNLIATWHPTFAYFHNPKVWGAFEIDLDRFKRMIQGKLEPLPTTKQLNVAPTWRDVRKLAEWCLKHNEPLIVDIETIPEKGVESDERWTGKNPLRCQMQLVGLGCTKSGLSIRWLEAQPRIMAETKRWLESTRITKCLQNGDWFDLRVFRRYGINVAPVEDIREMRRALVATSPLRLDYQGSLLTDYFPWKSDHQANRDEKGYVFTTDVVEKQRYNIHDCIVTGRCRKKHVAEEEWNTPRIQRLYEHQRWLAIIAAEMGTGGIRVDKMRRYFMDHCMKQEYQEHAKSLEALVAIPGWKSSPDNLRALIYSKHAVGKKAAFGRFNLPDPLDPDMYSNPEEMGTIGVGEEQLTLLLIDPSTPPDLKQIIKKYWEVQGIRKKHSTYVVSTDMTQGLDANYVYHPEWNSCGTETGRFSGFMMVFPKDMRAMIVADPGCLILGADYKQMELRVMYAVTGDEALGDGIRKGNVYVEEAKSYFGLPDHIQKLPDDIKEWIAERHLDLYIKPAVYKVTKNTRLAAQFGSGKKKFFSQIIGMDRNANYDEMMRVRDAFLNRNHRTVEWWEEETERVMKCGYSQSHILDRRRYYARPPDRPDIANYPIQSTAADVKNIALIKVFRALKHYRMKTRIIIDLHDAMYLNAPYKEVSAANQILQTYMEAPYKILGKTYSFPVDMGQGERWSDFN